MVKVHYHNESFVFLECDLDQAVDINNRFAFFADNYFYSPKYKSGIWDGKIKLFRIKTGLFPIGLLSDLFKYFKLHSIKYQIVDKNIVSKARKYSKKKICDFNSKVMKNELTPRDYQLQSVQLSLYHKKRVILSPTASGKSFIIFLLFNMLKYLNDDFNFLLLVPTTSLVEQMASDFQEYAENLCDFDEYTHKIYSGKDKNTTKPITISTWQSMQNMPTKYFEKFDAVVCDEVHTAKGAELANIIQNCVNAEYKIGLSGTLQDSSIDKLQLKSLFGQINRVTDSKTLMKRGLLSKLRIKGIILNHNNADRNLCKKMVWQDEVAFINSKKDKIRLLSKLIEKEDNSLILFKTIEYGKTLYECLKKKYPNKQFFYVDGSVSTDYRENIRKVSEVNDNVVIVASYGTFSTGINIKNLHKIMFAESMKSSIKIIQSIGRVLRLHKNKKFATLYDICDNLSWKKRYNYTLNHFLHRIEIYEKEGFNYSIKEIDLK